MKTKQQCIEQAEEELRTASHDTEEGNTEGARLHLDIAYGWIVISRESWES